MMKIRSIKRSPHTKKVKKRRRDGVVQSYWVRKKDLKKKRYRKRKLGVCPICKEIVYDITTRDFIRRLKPLYKHFEGRFYHNSKTKPCWEKFNKSRYKTTNIEAGGELSTTSLAPIKAKAYITRRREH